MIVKHFLLQRQSVKAMHYLMAEKLLKHLIVKC